MITQNQISWLIVIAFFLSAVSGMTQAYIAAAVEMSML